MLRLLLRELDKDYCPPVSFDDVHEWPAGTLDAFLKLDLMREIEPATGLQLWECERQEWVEPMFLPDKETGRVLGFVGCSHPDCAGIHTVELERMRQWMPCFEGVAASLVKALGLLDHQIEDVPGRVVLLGNLARGRRTRDVFLVRGAKWPDGRSVLAGAKRLGASARAAVMCLSELPTLDQRPPAWQTVVSVKEIVTMNDGAVSLPVARLFEDQSPLARPCGTGELPMLAQTESNVLEAMAENPKAAHLVVDLVAASGYGRDSVMKAVKRLTASGLAARPTDTRRKGVVVTERGMDRVGRLPKTA